MTLRRVELDYETVTMPGKIVEFLRSVEGLIEQHRVNTATTFQGFVPSDYQTIYRCLRAVFDSHLLTGDRFCEWGSGIGVVASLAAMIGYESYGIELDGDLCEAAEKIRNAFRIPVELVHGSFIPQGVEDLIVRAFTTYDGELAMQTSPDNAYEEMDYAVNDFDLIFAYPWPNDVELTHDIFDRCAARGALLLVYYETDSIGLFRKD